MKLKYISKTSEIDDVVTFCFEALEPIDWIAGQSIRLEVPAGYDSQERRFTIVSAPYQRQICITTRISDSLFKQALNKLAPEAVIDGYAVEGKFIWTDTPQERILCAGGIGITPYMSMFRQLHHDGKPIDATLLYAGRSDRLLFEDELKRLQAEQTGLSVVFLPQQRLSSDIIRHHSKSLKDSLVYLSGPAAMVDELSAKLSSVGFPPEQIKKDWFTGWDEPL